MQLLNYSEFKKLADFSQDSDDTRFQRRIELSQSIYLSDLIGADLVAKLQAGNYSELLPYVKWCLTKEIEMYFVQTAHTKVSNEGLHERRSEFSSVAKKTDKDWKVETILKDLQRLESHLIAQIQAGDYEEYNDNQKVSVNKRLTITSVG